MPIKPTIAYLTSLYPYASDTFVRVEVEQLREMGFAVHPYSVKRPTDDMLVDPAIRAEAERTTYLLHGGMRPLLRDTLHAAITRPRRFARALGLAWRTGDTGLKRRVRQLSYLMDACVLARSMRQRGVEHLHNHIGENSATVAMLASELSDIGYSMTIHGPGIFFHPRSWALGEKVARSRFTACITRFCRSQCMIFTPAEHWPKLKLVRCGVGRRFVERDPVAPPAEPRLLCVGRLCAEKGHLLLLEAARRLADEGVGLEIRLIGDGPLRTEIERFVEEHGLADRVQLLGWQSSDVVADQLDASRALVLASFAEGLPVVIMEAFARARPVIATRIAGIGELVEHDRTGWLSHASDIDSLVHALREALQAEPTRIECMGDEARRRVLAQHDIAREVARLAGFIEAAIGGKASTQPRACPAPVASSDVAAKAVANAG